MISSNTFTCWIINLCDWLIPFVLLFYQQEDDNANEPICGAVGSGVESGGGDEASAVIEGPEGDMIAVDTPERPTTDIPALFRVIYIYDMILIL